jgi:hypothetical protein
LTVLGFDTDAPPDVASGAPAPAPEASNTLQAGIR